MLAAPWAPAPGPILYGWAIEDEGGTVFVDASAGG